jgi:nicotinamide mononucleotide transporter
MDEVLRWLDSAALVIAGAPISWAEVLGAVSGLACVALVARQHVWNWPVGLINNVFWALLFWRAKLYSDSTLQGVFFALGCYGWWEWVRRHGPDRAPLVVTRTRPVEWLAMAVAGTAVMASWTWWLAERTDSPEPLWDSSILALSLVATYGQARKRLESWWLWIVVDVISVPLYLRRGLVPTAAVYAVVLGLCVLGLREWRAAQRDEAASEPAAAIA